jgi:ribonucleoside-diphosphate reductase alpha chain
MNVPYNYEDITFEMKHVKIVGADNNIIFEDNIEFPIDFDNNGAAVVASRYLCNDINNKETSLTQMIDRVSNTISRWGLNQKYFNVSGFDIFSSKLKYYQVHKYFAFNSPVYFNVGNQEIPQSSACFILSVEDDIDSITQLGKFEARIFKKGSGAGTNYSNLRSSKETVTGGGTASGPVSFLKSLDVSAAIIKSGGTLRRSAKLACLNIDHPDIEEFIDCKLFEEEKLHALRKAGIKNRPGYDLADEVFFQNTNLSVRNSDEFMKAVIEDKSWDTKFVKSGKSCKTYKARDLLKKIAETSHKIADPGVQFHDTFNKWNTLANDGIIESTNP